MKINWNKKYTTIAVYSLLVIAAAVLFVVFVFRFESFANAFSWIGAVAAPIICGVVIAYILNPLMMLFENKVFRKLKETPPPEEGIVMKQIHKTAVGESNVVKQIEKHSASVEKKIRRRRSAARVLSIILTYIVLFAVIVGMCIAVVPSVAQSLVDLADQMPGYIEKMDVLLKDVFANNPDIAKLLSAEISNLAELLDKIAEMVQPMASDILGNVSTGLINAVLAIVTALKNIIIGLVIAIYLLYSKERMLGQIKKIFFAFFRSDRCERFFEGCMRCNSIFNKYIISNLLDSLIVFVAMMIGMFAMGMPFPVLISVVCGITNLVPFFGPFIGAIPCGVLILLVDPIKVIWFGIFVLVLQQLDGNVIKPFLFGETM
ncbi:MAG: AI-2E family transporter, partial [Oscillospiraceae bacterium]